MLGGDVKENIVIKDRSSSPSLVLAVTTRGLPTSVFNYFNFINRRSDQRTTIPLNPPLDVVTVVPMSVRQHLDNEREELTILRLDPEKKSERQ